MKKVSIIIPIYNTPIIPLRECIESIIKQSYMNLEILLINDGSTDECTKIITEYNYDTRIKLINKENGGVSSARNVGIDNATGEYIMFVDADDMLVNDAVNTMIKCIEQTKADIIICDYCRFYKSIPKSKDLTTNKLSIIFEQKSDLNKLRKKCLHEDDSLGIRFNGAPWGKLYSSRIIKENKIRYNESLVRSQDNFFNFEVFGIAKKIGYINAQLYLYRYLPSSSVNRFRINLFEISQKYLNCIENKIELEGNYSEYKDTIKQIKLEKYSEYVSSHIAHPLNIENKKSKIKKIKTAKECWIREIDNKYLSITISSKREQLFYRLIINKKYLLAYYYIKIINILRQIIIKIYNYHG